MNASSSNQRSTKAVTYKQKDGLKLFFIALPFMLMIFAFAYVPLFGWGYAFLDFRFGRSITEMNFVGFRNFERLITEWSVVRRVLRNTLAISFLTLLASPLPMFFAIMLNEIKIKKFKAVAQTITTLPNFISWIVVFGIAFSLFSINGGMTQLLLRLGIDFGPTGILGNNDAAWYFQTFLHIWKNLGWGAIIYLAAISSVDSAMYEAAEIDGANRVRCIIHITIPSILPTYFVLLLLAIGNLLNNGFEQYFVFHNPLVADRLMVLDYYVYVIGLVAGDFSYSIVVGMLRSIISVGLLFAANYGSKLIRGESLI